MSIQEEDVPKFHEYYLSSLDGIESCFRDRGYPLSYIRKVHSRTPSLASFKKMVKCDTKTLVFNSLTEIFVDGEGSSDGEDDETSSDDSTSPVSRNVGLVFSKGISGSKDGIIPYLIELYREHHLDNIIIVICDVLSSSKVTPQGWSSIAKFNEQTLDHTDGSVVQTSVFTMKRLRLRISTHFLQSRFSPVCVAKKGDTIEVLKRTALVDYINLDELVDEDGVVSFTQLQGTLPSILCNDAMVVWMGYEIGDIVKIERPIFSSENSMAIEDPANFGFGSSSSGGYTKSKEEYRMVVPS